MSNFIIVTINIYMVGSKLEGGVGGALVSSFTEKGFNLTLTVQFLRQSCIRF